jgi:hypothetical protein
MCQCAGGGGSLHNISSLMSCGSYLLKPNNIIRLRVKVWYLSNFPVQSVHKQVRYIPISDVFIEDIPHLFVVSTVIR